MVKKTGFKHAAAGTGYPDNFSVAVYKKLTAAQRGAS
jgi:hypothetical protein